MAVGLGGLNKKICPKGSHTEDCHHCPSTLATFAEIPIYSGFQDANIINNSQGCHANNTGDLGNIGE